MKRVPAILLALPVALALAIWAPFLAAAQTAPTPAEIARYTGLHKAAHEGDAAAIARLAAGGADINATDGARRTPLHVAAFASKPAAVRALAKAGAGMNALEHQAYDVVTIAAVANDLDVLEAALASGASAANITSPYHGTALIAAAHLGHHKVVTRLIAAGAPLDHVNNLGWTALIEAVILGDGSANHIETVRALVKAGASRSIADRQGATPLMHARTRGFTAIAQLLQAPAAR